ncbi:MAG TPA: hypothetical protein DCG49_10240 [Ruminococcus sp.]|nr:hypothetical protein [Ruminococcus sp.]
MEHAGKVTFMNQEYQNEKTGEKVRGITVIVDGAFKLVLDKLISESPNPDEMNYTKVIQEALFRGINELIGDNQKKKAEQTEKQ